MTATFLAGLDHSCSHFEDEARCGWPEAKRFMNGWLCAWHAPNSTKGGSLMELPAWLQQRIGKPSQRRGAKETRCIVCKAPILVGMSEDKAAHIALVDPIALSPLGEMLALIDGRNTYQLGKYDRGLALWQRDHWRISGQPAGPDWIILTDHKCESTAKFPSVEVPLSAPRKGPVENDDPPF